MNVNMKKIQSLIFAMLLLLPLASCQKENGGEPKQIANNGPVVRFSIDMNHSSNKDKSSLRDAVPVPDGTENTVKTQALPREKQINDLYAVIFKENGAFLETVKVKMDVAPDKYYFEFKYKGKYFIHLVANPTSSLVELLKTKVSTEASLSSIIADQDPGDAKLGSETGDGKAGFLMYSPLKSEVFDFQGSELHIPGTAIILERLAARIDVMNTIPDLKLTSITLKNRAEKSVLARGANINMNKDVVVALSDKEYQNDNPTGTVLNANDCIGAIYTYENLEIGKTGLTINGTYKEKPFTHTFKIERVPVKRNHIYSIVLASKSGSVGGDDTDNTENIKFIIHVNDWNEGGELKMTPVELTDNEAPTFTVSGAGVSGTPTNDPTNVDVTGNNASKVVTFTVTSKSAPANIGCFEGTKEVAMPAGYTLSSASVSEVGGKKVQTFTLTIDASVYNAEYTFRVYNTFNPDKKKEFKLQYKSLREKMPVEFMKKNNVDFDGRSFTSNENNLYGGFFTPERAKTISLSGYHCPSAAEILAVIGKPVFSSGSGSTGITEIVSFGSHTNLSTTADYSCVGNVCYAIRLKDSNNKYTTAYKYEFKDEALVITSKYIGSTSTSLTDLQNPSYFNPGDNVVTISIPLSGVKKDINDVPADFGTKAFYITNEAATPNVTALVIDKTAKTVEVKSNVSATDQLFNLRLMSDK